jgi:hypothetical protein
VHILKSKVLEKYRNFIALLGRMMKTGDAHVTCLFIVALFGMKLNGSGQILLEKMMALDTSWSKKRLKDPDSVGPGF